MEVRLAWTTCSLKQGLASIVSDGDESCIGEPIYIYAFRLKLEALGDKDPGLLDPDSDHEEQGTQSTEPGLQTALPGDTTAVPTLPNSQEPGGDLPASQPQPTTAEALLNEEDLLIEEYDSD